MEVGPTDDAWQLDWIWSHWEDKEAFVWGYVDTYYLCHASACFFFKITWCRKTSAKGLYHYSLSFGPTLHWCGISCINKKAIAEDKHHTVSYLPADWMWLTASFSSMTSHILTMIYWNLKLWAKLVLSLIPLANGAHLKKCNYQEVVLNSLLLCLELLPKLS